MINAAFTNGEHLENTQSVTAPRAMTVIGGNIVATDGTRVSSQDSWLLSNAEVYALTSDARRHTLLADGRDLLPDWPQYNDDVGDCVGQSTRASNVGAPPGLAELAPTASATELRYLTILADAGVLSTDGDRCNMIDGVCIGAFTSAQDALSSGQFVCSEIAAGTSTSDVIESLSHGEGLMASPYNANAIVDAATANLC